LTFPAIAACTDKCLGAGSLDRYFTSAQNQEEIQMQIPIDIEVLKSVHAMTDDEARQIIDQTTKVTITKSIDVKPERHKITLEAPTDLGDGPWEIALVNKDGGTLAKFDSQRPITIDIEVLKSVHAMTEDEAQQIIRKTERVRINEDKLIHVKEPKNQGIVVPTNLGDGLLVIDLINEHGGTTTLAYDLKEKKFRHEEE
jgi:hypothetical protein